MWQVATRAATSALRHSPDDGDGQADLGKAGGGGAWRGCSLSQRRGGDAEGRGDGNCSHAGPQLTCRIDDT